MAKSTTKTVLFTLATDGKTPRQWPVAVFNDDKTAKAYAAIVRLAYRSGDVAAVKGLDPQVKLTSEDKLLSNPKFSLLSLPYSPEPDLGEDDDIASSTPAS